MLREIVGSTPVTVTAPGVRGQGIPALSAAEKSRTFRAVGGLSATAAELSAELVKK
jgi:hypothetical protein